MNETTIKKKCDDYMKSQGWIPFRLRSVDGSGWPDCFYIKNGRCVFIEYKTPSGKLSAIQYNRIAEIQEQQFDVFVISDINLLKEIFK